MNENANFRVYSYENASRGVQNHVPHDDSDNGQTIAGAIAAIVVVVVVVAVVAVTVAADLVAWQNYQRQAVAA